MRKQLPVILRIILVALFGFHIYSLTGDNDMQMAISKSLLMPVLAVVYLILGKLRESHKLDLLIVLALIFSWFGDVFLIKGHQEPNFFMYGLGAFLVAHIFYIVSFYRDMRRTAKTSLIVSRPHFGLPFLIVSFFFIYFLLPNLGSLKLPVIVYTGVITTMVLAASNRWEKVSSASFWLVMLGAMSFYSSDAMIAINKFYAPFEHQRLAIMCTYILGQWAIVEGILLRKD